MSKVIRATCTLLVSFCALQVSSAGAELSEAEKTTLLERHNSWRAEYQMSALVWDETVAQVAQEWADQLASTDGFAHRPGGLYGENLWGGTAGQFPIASVVDYWGSERDNYDADSNTCATGEDCGHFTQMVWWNTSRLGCGKATGAGGSDVVVCNYDPRGNMNDLSPFGD